MSKGFTLIEILVAVSIIGMLAISIIPGFRRFNDDQLLKNATSDLVQQIRKAQINSQSRLLCSDGKPSFSWGVTFNVSSGKSTYQLVSQCQDPQNTYGLYNHDDFISSLSGGI